MGVAVRRPPERSSASSCRRAGTAIRIARTTPSAASPCSSRTRSDGRRRRQPHAPLPARRGALADPVGAAPAERTTRTRCCSTSGRTTRRRTACCASSPRSTARRSSACTTSSATCTRASRRTWSRSRTGRRSRTRRGPTTTRSSATSSCSAWRSRSCSAWRCRAAASGSARSSPSCSGIHNHLIFLGTGSVDLGGIALLFYCFRERDRVLDLFELAGGVRMHPRYCQVGGVAEDIPRGFDRDARAVRQGAARRASTSTRT